MTASTIGTRAAAAPAAPAQDGMTTGEPDLWCTYAAVRTLAWLDRISDVTNPGGTAGYLLSRRNADGGYAWSKGMQSDAWATFYCTQALTDLGRPVPGLDRTTAWLLSTWSGEAFAMVPGQAPDVWATHYSTRTLRSVCGTEVPDRTRMLAWLGSLQTAGGGLSWTPGHATAGKADVRACHYAVAAWEELNRIAPSPAPWDVPALSGWLRDQQTPDGGFRFSPEADLPCMWATYRATTALRALGARPAKSCEAWIRSLRGVSGAFVRWPGYDVEDVWAAFCGIGSLRAIDAPTASVSPAVVARIAELACAEGGYTYREPDRAADVLSTAAAVLATPAGGSVRPELRAWLEGCQLPNEGGLMYMPGRGSEVRCTLWGVAAGAFLADQPARRRIADWLREIQNPDGGFGYWEGRGSDLPSTAAAVEIVRFLVLAPATTVDTARLGNFVRSCRRDVEYASVPGGRAGLRAGLQALRIWHALDLPAAVQVTALLDRHRVPSGGYANEGARVPDLLSTYEAVVTADLHGVPVDDTHLSRFLDRVQVDQGTAWTPLSGVSGGPLADCLGTLLRRRVHRRLVRLPALTL